MKSPLEVFYNKSKIKNWLVPTSCLLVFLPFEVINLVFHFLQRPANQLKNLLPITISFGILFLIIYYFIFELFKLWYKKYTLKKPIFIIDDKGITDKISYNSVGFIPWSNIKKVSAFTSRKHYLVFFLENKDDLINKFKSVAKKKRIARTFKKNGANIRVEVDLLDANIYVMKKFAQAKLEEHKSKQSLVVSCE